MIEIERAILELVQACQKHEIEIPEAIVFKDQYYVDAIFKSVVDRLNMDERSRHTLLGGLKLYGINLRADDERRKARSDHLHSLLQAQANGARE